MDETGNILMRLIGVDVPLKINNGAVEVCCVCGGLTISGIYELKSKDDVMYMDNGDNKYEVEIDEIDCDGDLE